VIRRGRVVWLLLVAACAVPVRVDTLGPDFEGARTVRLRGNVMPTPVAGIGPIELNAERIARPEQPNEYALLVEVRADGLRIRAGESLRLALDGDTVLLARDTLATTWPRLDPTVQEQARYPAPDSVLRRLATARDAAVEVRGAGWWEKRRPSAENLEVLRGFVALYVVPDSVPAANDSIARP
jgi:hypothetical protein